MSNTVVDVHPIQMFLAASFVIVGLSHIFQPRRWSAFFTALFASNCGPFGIAMYTLPLGLAIVLMHNVWAFDWRVIVTIYGWAAIVKGTWYFVFPSLAERAVNRSIRRPRHFQGGGAILLVLGGLLLWDAL